MVDITSRKNEKAVHMKKLGSSKEYRRISREFLCDGIKLLEEAIKSGADIRQVFLCGDIQIEIPKGVKVFSVTREVIEAVSPLKTPQPVVFSVGMAQKDLQGDIKKSIILENIQDPGNVGTVIRTANAFGIKDVILTGACADPWSPKAVRATMGAAFRQRIREMTLDEIACAGKEVPIYGAALSQKARDVREIDLSECAVAIGSEGRGLTRELLSICSGELIIPMRPECESLNAAAAASIIMWKMAGENL